MPPLWHLRLEIGWYFHLRVQYRRRHGPTATPDGGTPFFAVAHSRDAILVPRAEFLQEAETIAASKAMQVFLAKGKAERSQAET